MFNFETVILPNGFHSVDTRPSGPRTWGPTVCLTVTLLR